MQNFERHIKVEECGFASPCWIWQGAKTPGGYGRFAFRTAPGKYRTKPAYVFRWEVAHGPVPVGLELDHLCRNRTCVNPDHLEAVTHAENMRRGVTAKITMTDAERIRELVASGISQKELGRRFSLAPCSISHIVHRRTWA